MADRVGVCRLSAATGVADPRAAMGGLARSFLPDSAVRHRWAPWSRGDRAQPHEFVDPGGIGAGTLRIFEGAFSEHWAALGGSRLRCAPLRRQTRELQSPFAQSRVAPFLP